MAFQFAFDNTLCIQCGICGDLCPVNTLDFTRPMHTNVEGSFYTQAQVSDMTEYPIQVNKCIGCMICQEECPVSCITIMQRDREPEYAPPQGPQYTEEATPSTFGLSEYTKVRPTKAKTKDPWGGQYIYRPRRRKNATMTLEQSDMTPPTPPKPTT